MKQTLNVVDWMKLDRETRFKLSQTFLIGKSGASVTADNVHVSDGTTEKDLEKMNVGKMIEYLGKDFPDYSEDFTDRLFVMVLGKLYGRTITPLGDIELNSSGNEGTAEDLKPRRRGRPRKEASGVSELA